ncbi:hypothetical protein LFL96_19565 [Paraburkholderia sp. D15]|uniref:hypothetical protein n=1 Tax=Paraburkholderia sp. D15 TaxID=2880218 RepID=UPI0024788B93|nr:hypothetical protein [Paraburkholderia sp. D15]WGS49917.1 hypothetical protein LFL96_19565 [Paraburkholderia sp. D15]
MRKLMSLMLLAATAVAFVPATAEAHSRVVCKRVWVHGRVVKRCRRVPVPHHHHHRRPPPHHRPAPYHP